MGALTTQKMQSAMAEEIASGRYGDLSREEKAAWGVLALTDEVRNGSFLQYFSNSSGTHSRDAVQSFTDLGASAPVVEAVRQALAHFAGGAPSEDPTVRAAQIETIDPSGMIFEPSNRVILDALPVLLPLLDRYVWEQLPALRATCRDCTSATLVSLFGRIPELLSQGTNVEIGRFGRFTAGRRSFTPSPELRGWIQDGEEALFSATDLAKLVPTAEGASSVSEELHEMCRRLQRDECEAVTIGRFYLGFTRAAGYAAINPRTGITTLVPGRRIAHGGFLDDDENP